MYNDVIQLLDQHRLKEAFTQLIALIEKTENWELKPAVESLQTTYNYMVQYAAQGMEDPGRENLYAQIHRGIYELADRVEFIGKLKNGYGHKSDTYRKFKRFATETYGQLKTSLESATEDLEVSNLMYTDAQQLQAKQRELYQQQERMTDQLFDKTWISDCWTEEEAKEANELLVSVLVPAHVLAVFVSAVTLNLMALFDPRKFQFLLNAYRQRTELVINQRALVGLALAVYYQEKRLAQYPELTAALSLWTEDPQVIEQLHSIQLLLLISRETEKIDRRMREEIIPQMMHNSQLLEKDLNIEEIDIEELEDKNPEWEKNMKKISENIRELGELQMEGADTYMGTFAQLKSYPFFHQAAHWFYPFNHQTPAIADLFATDEIKEKSFLNIMLQSPTFCNSDKYSFCLTLNSLPHSQRNMLTEDLGEHNEMMQETFDKMQSDEMNQEKANTVARQYMHDLYRFFKLWMFRNEQHDMFTDELALWKCTALRPLILAGTYQKQIADFLFSKEYLPEAAELYIQLSIMQSNDPDIWQKLGFVYQKQKKYDEAIQAYIQADLLKPDHIWTLKHLAQCYKRSGNYQKALEYFQRVEQSQPENLNLLLQIGQCLAILREYDKALAYFFKVEYLEKTPANAQRAIGWCYFMTGKYPEAHRFYEKLLESEEPQTSDWLNNGHVYAAEKNIPKALECYREVMKSCKTHDDFLKIYLADKEVLLEQGISETTIYLIPDLLS